MRLKTRERYKPNPLISEQLTPILDWYNLTEDRLWEHYRRGDMVDTRCVAWLFLLLRGYPVVAIADHAGYNHSTVSYGIKRCSRDRALVDLAHALAATGTTAVLVDRVTRRYPVYARYFRHLLLCLLEGAPFTTDAHRALQLLYESETVRNSLYGLLRDAGFGAHIWRIELHARKLGLGWVA